MTIDIANLGASANPDINNSTSLSSYANASWIPPETGLIICDVHSRHATTTPNVPTISGNSLTWVEVETYGVGLLRVTRFAALTAGATEGVTTIDFGGQNQRHCNASFYHVTGADVSGGVAGVFVQHVGNNGTDTGGSITLADPENEDNRPVVVFMHEAVEPTTPRTNWVELDDLQSGGDARGFETQYRSDAFETTASATWTTSADWIGLASEIKAEEAGGVTVTPAAATVGADAIAPAVVLGAIVIVPGVVTVGADAIGPDVILGGIVPEAVTVKANTIAPVVILGAIVIVPGAAAVRAIVVDPVVIGGGGIPDLGAGDSPGFIAFMLAHAFYNSLIDAGLEPGIDAPDGDNSTTWGTWLFG